MKITQNGKPSRVRFTILAAVFMNVVINYMDRSNISVAAPMISEDLHLTPVQLGYIFSSFGWTYALLQIPGGILVDYFGPRVLYAFSLISWSAATIAHSFANGFASLIGLRMTIGILEAPSYPTNNRIVTTWFPNNERASAIAVYTSGQFIGLAFLSPLLTTLEHYTGWKGLFIITGIVGIIWGVVWYYFYRSPEEHPRVNEAELKYIECNRNTVNRKDTSFQWRDLAEVISHKKLWGIYLGQFAVNSTMWFFLTWFPTYLVKYRGISFIKSGFLSSAPFLCAFIGILLSGFLSDYMMKKGVSASVARKTPVITGLVLSVFIVGANYVSNPAFIIFFMCLSFFGNGFASITWVFVSALSPERLLGLTGGMFNFIGGLAAVFTPLIIGYLIKNNSFAPAIIFIGMLAILGAFSYIFLVGKVERIETKQEALLGDKVML